ncbi:uncharacterized protein LOC121375900 [Gigantopelta aegis]|uniref:uncharacterized protein LOC121375900 n=1 Tax=Gigantopelta aegis TaxID=1735272 RepID=UPI001B88BD55|nr:uncharacterized protein LOC121375900 [Gigantopelta aegis]
MSKAKQKYEASKAKLKPLTPIKETSNLYTPRLSEKKTVLVQRNKPIVVQTLPEEVLPRQPTNSDRPKPYSGSRRGDDVEQVVEEYLNYSKYSSAMPVQHEILDGRSTLTCACCQKRNMENMRLKREVAIASNLPRASLELSDSPSPKDTRTSPRRERNVEATAQQKNPSDWIKYQPVPSAQTYLSPEFNRPYVLQDFYDNSQLDAQSTYVKVKIIDADARYKEAMEKLERTSQYFGPDRTDTDNGTDFS